MYVPDVNAALDYYEKVFGLKRLFVDAQGVYGQLDTGGPPLGFAALSLAHDNLGMDVSPSRAHTPPPFEIALLTEDVAGLFNHAVRAGAVVVAEPEPKFWGQTIGYVRDLNGFLVEIGSPMAPPSQGTQGN